MPDMIRDGAAWMAVQLRASAGSDVVATRGEQSTTVTAIAGRSVFQSIDGSGVTETWESRDFIIAVEDLPFGDVQRHDKFTETTDAGSRTYAVTAPRGIPIQSYTDAFQQSVKIHTQRVE